jgi:hypothetical protein
MNAPKPTGPIVSEFTTKGGADVTVHEHTDTYEGRTTRGHVWHCHGCKDTAGRSRWTGLDRAPGAPHLVRDAANRHAETCRSKPRGGGK